MGKSLGELERMPAANALYMKVIEGNIRQIGERMKCMKLGERNVEVIKYPMEEDARLLHNVMRDYDKTTRGKMDQSKMKRIDRMLRFPKHAQMLDYILEFKLCGEVGCDLCSRMPRVFEDE